MLYNRFLVVVFCVFVLFNGCVFMENPADIEGLSDEELKNLLGVKPDDPKPIPPDCEEKCEEKEVGGESHVKEWVCREKVCVVESCEENYMLCNGGCVEESVDACGFGCVKCDSLVDSSKVSDIKCVEHKCEFGLKSGISPEDVDCSEGYKAKVIDGGDDGEVRIECVKDLGCSEEEMEACKGKEGVAEVECQSHKCVIKSCKCGYVKKGDDSCVLSKKIGEKGVEKDSFKCDDLGNIIGFKCSEGYFDVDGYLWNGCESSDEGWIRRDVKVKDNFGVFIQGTEEGYYYYEDIESGVYVLRMREKGYKREFYSMPRGVEDLIFCPNDSKGKIIWGDKSSFGEYDIDLKKFNAMGHFMRYFGSGQDSNARSYFVYWGMSSGISSSLNFYLVGCDGVKTFGVKRSNMPKFGQLLMVLLAKDSVKVYSGERLLISNKEHYWVLNLSNEGKVEFKFESLGSGKEIKNVHIFKGGYGFEYVNGSGKSYWMKVGEGKGKDVDKSSVKTGLDAQLTEDILDLILVGGDGWGKAVFRVKSKNNKSHYVFFDGENYELGCELDFDVSLDKILNDRLFVKNEGNWEYYKSLARDCKEGKSFLGSRIDRKDGQYYFYQEGGQGGLHYLNYSNALKGITRWSSVWESKFEKFTEDKVVKSWNDGVNLIYGSVHDENFEGKFIYKGQKAYSFKLEGFKLKEEAFNKFEIGVKYWEEENGKVALFFYDMKSLKNNENLIYYGCFELGKDSWVLKKDTQFGTEGREIVDAVMVGGYVYKLEKYTKDDKTLYELKQKKVCGEGGFEVVTIPEKVDVKILEKGIKAIAQGKEESYLFYDQEDKKILVLKLKAGQMDSSFDGIESSAQIKYLHCGASHCVGLNNSNEVVELILESGKWKFSSVLSFSGKDLKKAFVNDILEAYVFADGIWYLRQGEDVSKAVFVGKLWANMAFESAFFGVKDGRVNSVYLWDSDKRVWSRQNKEEK